MNCVSLVGRLTRDPELRKTPSGKSCVRFVLAVNRIFESQNGQKADFPTVVTYGKTADNVSLYCSKGDLIEVDGRLQTGSYEDKNGRTIYTCEVIANRVGFLTPKSKKEDDEYYSTKTVNIDEDFDKDYSTMDDDIEF